MGHQVGVQMNAVEVLLAGHIVAQQHTLQQLEFTAVDLIVDKGPSQVVDRYVAGTRMPRFIVAGLAVARIVANGNYLILSDATGLFLINSYVQNRLGLARRCTFGCKTWAGRAGHHDRYRPAGGKV